MHLKGLWDHLCVHQGLVLQLQLPAKPFGVGHHGWLRLQITGKKGKENKTYTPFHKYKCKYVCLSFTPHINTSHCQVHFQTYAGLCGPPFPCQLQRGLKPLRISWVKEQADIVCQGSSFRCQAINCMLMWICVRILSLSFPPALSLSPSFLIFFPVFRFYFFFLGLILPFFLSPSLFLCKISLTHSLNISLTEPPSIWYTSLCPFS